MSSIKDMQMPELTFFRTLTRPKSSYKTVVITFGVRLFWTSYHLLRIDRLDRMIEYCCMVYAESQITSCNFDKQVLRNTLQNK